MRVHQKYLPVRGPRGLLPYFVAVMDNVADSKGLIAKGNEWVLNARLADARFFFDADLKDPLESRLEALSRLTFQDRLGDYRQKTGRIQDLSETIAHAVGRPDLVDTVLAAARLAKVDLTTLMVKEFTDLQGVVGGIYARREGYPDSVWKAIYDQYRPASATDDPPREAAGAILSLADRFDTLAGLFTIGLVPTGSKDPYGLRRTAFGVVSIAVARRWRLDWRPVVRTALSLYPPATGAAHDRILSELETFFAERLRNLLERRGHTYDEISAVLNVGVWDFADAADRAEALSQARREIDFRTLVLAFKRIRNIVGPGEARRRPSVRRPVPRARRAAAGGRLLAGPRVDPGAGRLAPLSRGHGDDRVDRAVARSILRGGARELPGGGPAPESACAARFDPEGVLEPRGFLGDRRRAGIGIGGVQVMRTRRARGRSMR